VTRSPGGGRAWIRSLAALGAVVVGAALWTASGRAAGQDPAAEPNANDLAAGLRIYRQKADCQACHGWAGDGRNMDTQMPSGANLRTTRLGRAGIVYAIKCGRPGREMPAFDRLAYTDDRCNGTTRADLDRQNLRLPDPAATLQPREIEQLADFLFAKVIGKGPMDHAACVEFWGSDVDVCAEFPD